MKKHRMLTAALAGILGLLSITGCTPNGEKQKRIINKPKQKGGIDKNEKT